VIEFLAAAPGITRSTTTRSVVFERYGLADVLRVRTVELPELAPDEVLVRVRATSINPAQWYAIAGPWFARIGGGWRAPKETRVSSDLAGHVEAVGSGVSELQVGDDVFGTGLGAWGEHAVAKAAKLAPKPDAVSFEDAAAVPIAGITALQGVRDHGKVGEGSRVLINGASGGVGTFAVQLAKWFGAEVTAVCSTPNVELARSLGADRVVDYRREDFCSGTERHDVMLDIAGSRPFRQFRRVLTPDATIVIIGAPMSARGLGPLAHIASTKLATIGRSQSANFCVAQINSEDLERLGGLLEGGAMRAVIDRRYVGLDQVADALRYLGEGHARGKIVVAV
jgi:NADPH:quinone reductase-like Zn-dependent oxidoreductase